MASRLYAKRAYSQWSVNSDTRLHPPLEFPSRSLLPQTTLRCRLLRARSPGFHPYGNSLLFKRMGGTKKNNRIFSQKTSVILKRQIESAETIVCVQDLTHFAFFAERRAGKMLNMEILKLTQTYGASA